MGVSLDGERLARASGRCKVGTGGISKIKVWVIGVP